MPAATVRIRESTRAQLRELESLTGAGPTEVLARAIDSFRRSLIFAETDIAYAAMQSTGEGQDDLDVWDNALGDGVDASNAS